MNAEPRFRFPSERFRSAEGFRAFLAARQAALDTRYEFEMDRAAAVAAPVLIADGSCGLCLRATQFVTELQENSAGVESGPAGSVREPNWREQQFCGCPQRLNCRFRALLHYIMSDIDPPAWTRVLLLGAAQPIETRLQRVVAQVAVRARSGRLLRAPRFEPQSYHLIISCEHLQTESALDSVLVGLRDALMPGGRLVFTAPFDTAAADSMPPAQGGGGVLGWDILACLARAGFAVPSAHLFWSAEFGYLGPFNLIFSASV
jgi:hypothetical protein